LPTEIGQLTSRLDVDGNQLWTLAEIGQLSSLRRLNAGGGNYRMVEEINA
jgi:Leucine-rich repeat (LRR) protein